MRATFTQLQQNTKDLIRDDSTTSYTGMSTTPVYVKREINSSVSFILDYLLSFKVQGDEITIETEADIQFYPNPPGLNLIHTVTHTIGNVAYPLEVIESELAWKRLNMVDYSGSTFPQYIFPRKNDFGIYPTPTVAGQDITFNAHYTPREMNQEDETTGTVAITTATTAVVGTGTAFTASMVGRWFQATDEGYWYKISAVTDATHLTLARTFYGGTVSGSNFTIAQSPELPEVLHELIPYKSAASWYIGARRDLEKAQPLLNYFWTGDFNNPNRESNVIGGLIGYANRARARGREKSTLVRRGKSMKHLFNESWTTTLS